MLTLVLLGAGASALLWHETAVRRLVMAEQERIEVFANIVSNDIGANLIAVNQALAGVVRDRLADPLHPDVEAVNRRLNALVEAMPSVRGLSVLDSKGTVTAAVPADLIGRNFALRDYFLLPQRQPDPSVFYLSPPFRSIRDDVVISASRVVPGVDGRFQGVVSAVLAPLYFSNLLRTVVYAADVRATVTSASGQVFIAAGAPASSGAGGSSSGNANTRAHTPGMMLLTVPPVRARRDIRAESLGMGSTLTLEISRDSSAVVASLQRQATLVASLLAVLAVGASATLLWSQRRRVRQLQLQAERLHERNQSAALRDSETRFRTLIEEAPVAVAMLRGGRFVYTNRRYNLLHGHPAGASMAGLPWRTMIAPDSLERLHEQETLIAADSPVEQHFEAVGVGSGQTRVPVFKATTRVELADGPATLIFTQDISPQKRAEAFLLEARDAAEAASRSKAEFLANMSHEIRTPLNAILGLAYVLEQSQLGEDAQTMLTKIRASGRSLLGIINDVLDVSKIEAGAMVIDRSWFPLQDVIDNVAATMGVAVGNKDIALLVQPLPREVASIMGDALRLEQLLVNLTSNAIKFTTHGQVELAVLAGPQRADRMELTFEVRDTGIGIDAAQQQAIFAPFTQADTSTTRRFGGTGLGLTICKQLVSLMGGQIGVRSTPGAGSVFWFSIPVQYMPAVASSMTYSSPEMRDIEVLAAAGEGPTLANTSQVAESLGWRLTTVAPPAGGVDEGARAHRADDEADYQPQTEALLAALRKRSAAGELPGVVLLDCPDDRAGARATLRTAREVRTVVGVTSCPVVVMTSTYAVAALGASAEGAAANGGTVDAVLTKPLTASTLYNAVIEARRKRASLQPSVRAGAPGARQLSGVRLLVVDDSEINREVARRILADQGASVALAEDGSAALAWLNAHPDEVDLVLMDVQMPVMDGIEATRQLRAMPRFAELPIVALTAGAFQSHHDAAREAGMSHFITKPFDIPLTIALIRRLTGLASDG
jgi:PAS domain S-box-containing protein